MTTTNGNSSGEIAALRHQTRISQAVVHIDLAGLTQAYHVGQTGLLLRLAGKTGAIA